MGRSVELSDVVPEIERFGALATLITVGEHGDPHVGSVLVEVGDERLVVRVGPTTAANMSQPSRGLAVLAPERRRRLPAHRGRGRRSGRSRRTATA